MRMRRRRRTRHTNPLSHLLSLALGVLIGAALAWLLTPKPEPIREEAPILAAASTPAYEAPQPYNDPEIPDDVEAAARAAGEAYGLSPELLEAIAYYESRYQPDAVNGDCTGLMQVSLYWHRDRMERLGITEADMWEPGPNMLVAADFLAELLSTYDGDLGAVLMYYNGDSRLDEHLTTGFLSEYAQGVMTMAEDLEAAHNTKEVVLMSAQK